VSPTNKPLPPTPDTTSGDQSVRRQVPNKPLPTIPVTTDPKENITADLQGKASDPVGQQTEALSLGGGVSIVFKADSKESEPTDLFNEIRAVVDQLKGDGVNKKKIQFQKGSLQVVNRSILGLGRMGKSKKSKTGVQNLLNNLQILSDDGENIKPLARDLAKNKHFVAVLEKNPELQNQFVKLRTAEVKGTRGQSPMVKVASALVDLSKSENTQENFLKINQLLSEAESLLAESGIANENAEKLDSSYSTTDLTSIYKLREALSFIKRPPGDIKNHDNAMFFL